MSMAPLVCPSIRCVCLVYMIGCHIALIPSSNRIESTLHEQTGVIRRLKARNTNYSYDG